MINQLLEENYCNSSNLKGILRNKDIIFENDIIKTEISLEDIQIQIFENIFESKKLIDNNENQVIKDENYFIKINSYINRNNSKEKISEENNIKKARKKKAKEKIFLIEKTDKKKKHMGRRKKEKKYRTKA